MIDNKNTHQLLLAHKKNQAIRKLSRSGTHSYNNIFAGLSGQLAMLFKDSGEEKRSERRVLIEDLLQRGIQQTELLYAFCLERKKGKRNQAAGRLADRAVSFLNAISREHVFQSLRQLSLPRVYCNSQDIVLMLFYLGENAIDAMTDSGTIILRTDVIEQDGVPMVCYSMIDSGGGIPENDKEKIFHTWKGTYEHCRLVGLGHFAVGRIAADHGATCSMHDRAGGGTVVSVKLPAAEPLSGPPEEAQPAVEMAMPRKKHVFLIVDDEEMMRWMLHERLKRRGHTVYCAKSCAEAVDEYRRLHEKITCIVLDIRLADSRGMQCAERLRCISSAVNIVFMSGIDDEKERERFASSPFLKKPFSIEQLEQIVK
ncbi:MAG TPA: response regulator [Desulfopila sp.]|nr:response regulator [Desulfopila sp.]